MVVLFRNNRRVKFLRCNLLTLLTLATFIKFTFLQPNFTLIDEDAGKRYLLFYNHSGFSNQLISLEQAAHFALATNRILVLPPVLPHRSVKESGLAFPAFKGRAAGNKCSPMRSYQNFLNEVENDVKKASNMKIPFPSFMDLFDFEGSNVIDMKDFVKDNRNTNSTNWCKGPKHEIEKKMVASCGDKASFADLIPYFMETCSLDRRIAVIGSAYVLPTRLSDPEEYFGEEAKFPFEALIPSQDVLFLLQEMYSRLPKGYTGVHIRFSDNQVIDDCDESAVKEAYTNVLNDLNDKNVPNDTHILIGNGNRAALKCFDHHAKGQYSASTINGMIDSNGALQRMIDNIKSEKSTIYLLLDQILIELSETVIFAHTGLSNSTFQPRILKTHTRRETIIEKMLQTH